MTSRSSPSSRSTNANANGAASPTAAPASTSTRRTRSPCATSHGRHHRRALVQVRARAGGRPWKAAPTTRRGRRGEADDVTLHRDGDGRDGHHRRHVPRLAAGVRRPRRVHSLPPGPHGATRPPQARPRDPERGRLRRPRRDQHERDGLREQPRRQRRPTCSSLDLLRFARHQVGSQTTTSPTSWRSTRLDWAGIETLKDGDERYLVGDPRTGSAFRHRPRRLRSGACTS